MTVLAGSGASQADKIFDKYILDSTSGNTSETLSAPVDPVELSKGITIGWNLGNSLDATGSGMNSETSWGNPKTTKSLILKVKEAGFNAVRIPTTWFNHSDSELNVDSAWFDRVQEVVDYAYDEGMYVILNAHHEDWYDPYESNLTNARRKMKNLWTQIANRFKDYGERLIFEGMNEPRWRSTNWEWNGGNSEGRSAVNKLNECFVKAVRATGGNNSYRADGTDLCSERLRSGRIHPSGGQQPYCVGARIFALQLCDERERHDFFRPGRRQQHRGADLACGYAV